METLIEKTNCSNCENKTSQIFYLDMKYQPYKIPSFCSKECCQAFIQKNELILQQMNK